MRDTFIVNPAGVVSIDVCDINPGDYIDPDSIAEAYGIDRDSAAFAFKLMWLRDHIEQESLTQGRPLLCKGEGYGLRVMQAEEAIDYLYSRFHQNMEGMRRALEKYGRIDLTQVNDDMRKEHERREHIMGRINQAALSERKKLSAPVGDYGTPAIEGEVAKE